MSVRRHEIVHVGVGVVTKIQQSLSSIGSSQDDPSCDPVVRHSLLLIRFIDDAAVSSASERRSRERKFLSTV